MSLWGKKRPGHTFKDLIGKKKHCVNTMNDLNIAHLYKVPWKYSAVCRIPLPTSRQNIWMATVSHFKTIIKTRVWYCSSKFPFFRNSRIANCAACKKWDAGKPGLQLNCRKFKGNQELFFGRWVKHQPKQQNQCAFRHRKQGGEKKGNKYMLFRLWTATGLKAFDNSVQYNRNNHHLKGCEKNVGKKHTLLI